MIRVKYDRPIALSIAGFDPTGGAGLLADIKTFEQHQVLGMGILSGNTVQTESNFMSVEWTNPETMKAQLEPIFNEYEIPVLKVGIVESLAVLKELCLFVKSKQSNCRIVWDPVLAASSGKVLHSEVNKALLIEILDLVFLITPNTGEAILLAESEDEIESAFLLSKYCAVLLKGGHSSIRKGLDILIENEIPVEIIGSEDTLAAKHGSGCILSAAITANLAVGHPLAESCKLAKQYIEKRLKSNSNLLAYHAS